MATPHQQSDEIGHRTVTDASVMTFASLTGDYARMHLDLAGPGAATPDGGGVIAHGLLSAAWSVGAVTLHAPQRLAIARPDAYLAALRIRFSREVRVGDRFSLRWSQAESPACEGLQELSTLDTDFEVLNQRAEVTCTGVLSVCLGEGEGPPGSMPPPEPMPVDAPSAADEWTSPLFAEDLLTLGPRGVSVGRTVTEADVVAFASFAGELNPLYLSAEFARSGPFGARIAPPMLTFCLGFGDYLRELLCAPMPSEDLAGHLGDSWRFFAPVHLGDTIRVRHKPVSCDRSKSRPGMAIVQFGLQLENQRGEIVQDGRVAMMLPTRDTA